MKIFFYFLFISIAIILGIVIFESISKNFYKSNSIKLDDSFLYKNYNQDELSYKIPKYHERTGLKCITKRAYVGSQGVWHPKKGYITKEPNYDCLKKHFSQDTLNIGFFGGSVMDSQTSTTINYLSAIDWNTISFNKNINSYNFAESGARLSNNLAHFIELLKYTKPDVAFFLDGWNEFNSIKYGGNSEDSFYWTTFYEKRFRDPWKLKIEMELYKLSIKFNIVNYLVNLFNIQTLIDSSKFKKIDSNKIIKAADEYNHYKKIISTICNEYEISCFFIIQPSLHNSINIDSKYYKDFLKYNNIIFPMNKKIYREGYPLLIRDEFTIDLSNLFDADNNIFIDEVHLNKKGNLIVSKIFKKIIMKELNKKLK